MTITNQVAAGKIAAYLRHEITLAGLVDWSESALLVGEFAENDAATISDVIARLGVADVWPGLGRLRRTPPQTWFYAPRRGCCSLIRPRTIGCASKPRGRCKGQAHGFGHGLDQCMGGAAEVAGVRESF